MISPVATNVDLLGPTLPEIHGADGHLLLRPWVEADAAQLVKAHEDASIQRWMLRWFESEAEATGWIERWQGRWRRHEGASWAVTDSSDPTYVLGQVAFRSLYLADGLAELSCWVAPACRRTHVGSDATAALAEWALERLGLERLELVHSMRNEAACRTAERAGFQVEGIKRRLQQYQDGFHDMHLHSRVRGDA